MRIVEIEPFGSGGLAHYTYNLAIALAARGHSVSLITAQDYELSKHPLPSGVTLLKTIRSIGLPGKWGARLEAVIDCLRVAVTVRRLNADVVHLHCTNSASLVYHWLFRLTGIPLVATAHVVTPHEPIRLQQSIYRRIHHLAGLVITHSKHDQDRLLSEFHVEPQRIRVIPHGDYGFLQQGGGELDQQTSRSRLGIVADSPTVLFFGYIREYKGLDILLEAWPDLVSVLPQATLVIAGNPVRLDPARRDELETLALSLGAVVRFEYIPFEDVAVYVAAADLMVMPYRRISQSGVLYLALSSGLPVVATKVGALNEVLIDGANAVLVPPGHPSALAEGMARVLQDPELRRTLQEGGLALSELHSWQSIAQLTESAFQDLMVMDG